MAGRKISDLDSVSADQVLLTDKFLLARAQGDNVIVSYKDIRDSLAAKILQDEVKIKEFQNFQLFLADQ